MLKLVSVAFLVRLNVLVCVAVAVAVAWLEVAPPPDAVARLVRVPASRSAWVIVCVPVQTTVAPGASEAAGIDGVQL